MIAGPDLADRFVACDPAFHDLAGATGLGAANQDIVDPAVGFEFANDIRVGVCPGMARSTAAGPKPGIVKHQIFDRTGRQPR